MTIVTYYVFKKDGREDNERYFCKDMVSFWGDKLYLVRFKYYMIYISIIILYGFWLIGKSFKFLCNSLS